MVCEGFMDREKAPSMEAIIEFVGSAGDYWCALEAFILENYQTSPKMFYSTCAAKPGWNVKFHKSGKSLCTLYPDKEYFTALVVVNEKESDQIRLRREAFGNYFNGVFETAGSLKGCKWLMLEVRDEGTLLDIKEVLLLKLKPKVNKDKKKDDIIFVS